MTENVQKNKKKRPYRPLKQNYYTLHPHPLRPRSSVGGLQLQQISLLLGLGRSLRHLCLPEGRDEVRAQVLGGLVVPEVGREAPPHNAVEDRADQACWRTRSGRLRRACWVDPSSSESSSVLTCSSASIHFCVIADGVARSRARSTWPAAGHGGRHARRG